jgi:hypothetical protein
VVVDRVDEKESGTRQGKQEKRGLLASSAEGTSSYGNRRGWRRQNSVHREEFGSLSSQDQGDERTREKGEA